MIFEGQQFFQRLQFHIFAKHSVMIFLKKFFADLFFLCKTNGRDIC